uniref:Zgc:113279 n=1 Tax=Gasterosteus aculeatus aculeatus TaxID=481459 RepID=A0AAQ4S235_GASAC
MRGRGKQREQSKGRDGRSPPAGDSEPGPAEAPRLRREDGGPTGPVKAYMGVRVKRPVRDLLKRVRVDQGWDSQRISGGSVKGDGPKVPMRAVRRRCNRKCSAKSLEELAMILEVLEEDLWTGAACRSSAQYPPTRNPQGAPFSPGWSSTGSEYYTDESNGVITSPESSPEYPWEPPPPFQPVGARGGGWADGQDQDLDQNVSFFWAQLHWVESRLGEASDGELLAPDHNGRAALHNVARVGKRALGYAIAKRMAALNSLDLKDSDGMTALLHAAQHNHHLMVADLILLGANVNETDNSGKTCLHLSAEKGYVRVLEVLKNAMLDGVYVDVEAADHSGEPEYATQIRLTTPASWRPDSNVLSWFRIEFFRARVVTCFK